MLDAEISSSSYDDIEEEVIVDIEEEVVVDIEEEMVIDIEEEMVIDIEEELVVDIEEAETSLNNEQGTASIGIQVSPKRRNAHTQVTPKCFSKSKCLAV